MIRISHALMVLLFFVSTLPTVSYAQSAPAASDKPFVVEYYYKTKWGHADEFLKLFKKNHYPLLKKEQMYPDQETFQREEQRRFEILDAHWDLPVKNLDLDTKP